MPVRPQVLSLSRLCPAEVIPVELKQSLPESWSATIVLMSVTVTQEESAMPLPKPLVASLPLTVLFVMVRLPNGPPAPPSAAQLMPPPKFALPFPLMVLFVRFATVPSR